MSAEWHRVLWKAQPVPDNYIHESSFLASLRKNRTPMDHTSSYPHIYLANFRPYAYWQLVLLSCAVTQHLASIFVFVAVFLHLGDHTLEPRLLIWASVCCFLTGYLVWEAIEFRDRSGNPSDRTWPLALHTYSKSVCLGGKILMSSILTFLALVSLSPVLRTLTAATSSDSIWALSALLFFLNALLADYTVLCTQKIVRERCLTSLAVGIH
jgi:phosphatidylinositol N-acetylglucosaminyltransferase subunit C